MFHKTTSYKFEMYIRKEKLLQGETESTSKELKN